MRRWQGLLLGLLAGLFVGCTTGEGVRPATWWAGKPRPLTVPAGADVVLMQVALIERPVGDRYLNDGLWPLVDESSVPSDHKWALEQNGFRTGQVGGQPPPELLALLTSERTCFNPRTIRFHAGDTKTLLLGPPQDACRFRLEQDGQPEDVALEQAQIQLAVVPALAPDGQIRLQFTPRIEHGERRLVLGATDDHAHLLPRAERDLLSYAALSWEITLSPNQYVVVGARSDRPGSLGYQAFVRPGESPPVQRLLAIRTSRTAPDAAEDGDDGPGSLPPVASQASTSAVPNPNP